MIFPATHTVIMFVQTEGTKDTGTIMNSAKVGSTSRKVTHIGFGTTVGVGADVETGPLGGLSIRSFAGDAIW